MSKFLMMITRNLPENYPFFPLNFTLRCGIVENEDKVIFILTSFLCGLLLAWYCSIVLLNFAPSDIAAHICPREADNLKQGSLFLTECT